MTLKTNAKTHVPLWTTCIVDTDNFLSKNLCSASQSMKRIANKWKVLYFLCLLLYLPLAFGFLMCPFSRYFLFIFIFILRSFTHSLSHSFTSFFVLPFLYLSLSLYSVHLYVLRFNPIGTSEILSGYIKVIQKH